jgi:hypothetical protein
MRADINTTQTTTQLNRGVGNVEVISLMEKLLVFGSYIDFGYDTLNNDPGGQHNN